ncbi:Crp/Fnr family transcriptional regulator [Sphingobium sp.]|uniref:Crp/Fnr family transcriptional regulator n=1 Tax=Sphingobium sp. TaxID=1912891 RepID=UPI002D1D0EFE|nr:Crp/Fnr family transcriptional regulator [Sphingobium sp.]HUD94858.1 Crp/Fnr family transcriptional regulator [Sphingobium sp.]
MIADALFAASDEIVPAHPVREASRLTRKLEAFLPLNEEERAALDHIAELNVRHFPAGSILVEPDSPLREVMIMMEGWAVRSKPHDTGRQIVALHLPGDICDFNALLTRRADCGIEAACDVRVACINHRMMSDITKRFPRIGQAFWCDSLSAGSVQREWTVNVATRNARARMSHLLCELHARLFLTGEADESGFDLPLRQTDLGNACGLTPETSSRVLARLKADRLVRLKDRRVEIMQAGALLLSGGYNAQYLHLNQTSDGFRAMFKA